MTSLGIPSGPPGPRPADTRPPSKPSTPPPPPPSKLAPDVDGFLHEIDGLLVEALAMASMLQLPADRIEECGQVILDFRLQPARRAVADLLAYQSPARVLAGPAQATRVHAGERLTPGYDTAGDAVVGSTEGLPPSGAGASSAPTVGYAAGSDRAGEPPLPGTGSFSLPRTPPFEIGAGAGRPLYDVLPGRSS